MHQKNQLKKYKKLPETEVTQELTKDMLAKTVSELKDIARENNISGYSSLKKQELVELIYQKLVSEKKKNNKKTYFYKILIKLIDK